MFFILSDRGVVELCKNVIHRAGAWLLEFKMYDIVTGFSCAVPTQAKIVAKSWSYCTFFASKAEILPLSLVRSAHQLYNCAGLAVVVFVLYQLG